MGWKKAKLSDIALVIMGQSPASKSYNENMLGLPLFQGKAEFGYIHPIASRWCTEPTRVSEPNDILLSIRAPVGPTNIADQTCCIGRGLAAIRCTENKAVYKYVYWFLKSIERFLSELGQGSTFKAINRGTIENIEIPLPPIEEQRRIAAILDKADAIRRKRQQAIALTEELLRSQFLEMFGDPVTNPKGWEVVTINDVISDVRDGPHVSPKYSDEGIPILSTRNIRPRKLILDDLKYISEETYFDLVKRFKPQRGDVLLTKGGTTGFAKAVDWDWPFAIWVHIAALRPTKRIRSEFLEAALNSPNCYAQSQKYTHGIANKDLGLTRIRKIQLSLPPLDLQDEYCNLREKILRQITNLEKSLNYSDQLFNSLLQRSFKGEL